MNNKYSIRLKAAFLLAIFSMNMVVGFACATGVDMGFNTDHHHEESPIELHGHADGNIHQLHQSKHEHKHQDGKDDCCNDRVVKISQSDKSIPQSAKFFSPVFFNAFTFAFYSTNVSYPSQSYTSTRYFVRGNHPPGVDIRVAIQSFQI